MSSTSRGGQRLADDFYETPAESVVPLLRWLGDRLHKSFRILDPCAGRGAILRVCYEHDFGVIGMELDPDRAAVCDATYGCKNANALDKSIEWPVHDAIVTNVPFSLSDEFLERILASGKPAAVLHRMAFAAGQERSAFWKAHPAGMGVLPTRPNFTKYLRWHKGMPGRACRLDVQHTKNGKCARPQGHDGDCLTCSGDSADYAWFVWGMHLDKEWERLEP